GEREGSIEEGTRGAVRHARTGRSRPADAVRRLDHHRPGRASRRSRTRPSQRPGDHARRTIRRVHEEADGAKPGEGLRVADPTPPRRTARVHGGTMPALNVNENFIHHEDVRRANGEAPRPPDAELNEVLTAVMR